jgi:hypothetical protein
MASILKVLKNIQKSETQALQIEVPSEILKGLNIQPDGSVDLEVLMQVCQRLARVKKLNAKIELAKQNLSDDAEKSENLMDLIFNPDRVIESETSSEISEKS